MYAPGSKIPVASVLYNTRVVQTTSMEYDSINYFV